MSADTDPRYWHTCPACGKRAWPSRRAARRAARGRYADLTAYPCPHRPGWWHLGHLPRSITRGRATRSGLTHIPDQDEAARAARATIRPTT